MPRMIRMVGVPKFLALSKQTLVLILLLLIFGSLMLYTLAQRRYVAFVKTTYRKNWRQLETFRQQQRPELLAAELASRQKIFVSLREMPELIRVSLLDVAGSVLAGQEFAQGRVYFPEAILCIAPDASATTPFEPHTISLRREHVQIVQIPVVFPDHTAGVLRGEFLIDTRRTVYLTIMPAALSLAIAAAGLIVIIGVMSLVSRLLHQHAEKQQRLEEYATLLEEARDKLRRAKKELYVSEKLASLGYLAAGIAHEIGNPLSAVFGYVDILRKGKIAAAKQTDILQRIEQEIERIRNIIQELVHFSRPYSLHLQQVDVNQMLPKITSRWIVGETKEVAFHLQLTDFPLLVEVDEQKLRSVFVNVLKNGVDAIAAHGEIRIATSRRIRESATMIGGSEVIAIQFSDTGCGIPEGDLARVFDPFFTTKDPGRGMGLGLSLCHRIIESLHGEIELHSTVGVGTEVTIFLPPARKKHQPETQPLEAQTAE